jgi:hypothetical protein
VRVAQFALPAFTTIAPANPFDDFKCFRLSRTGAACTRFVVNTPAALAGSALTMSARSGFATLRIPAYTAEYA